MKMWKRMSAGVLAALLLALPVAEEAARASGGPAVSDLARTKARQMAEVLVDNYGVTGVQYAIRDEGKVVLSGGLGVTESGSKTPVAKEAMFGIGSVSKMYVTAAAMMLADAGKINIDEPLTAYIPEFKMADERYKRITPRMLMNHSAGLYGSHYKNSMLMDDNDTGNHDQLLENLRSQRLKSDPGEYSVYANDGFQLLEILVERVSGMSYSEFLARHVGEPLQLTSTKTPLDEFDRGRLYPTRFPGIAGALPPENANVIGTGGVYSTAEELTLFAEVLTGEKPELLSAASASAMQQPEYRKGVWVKDETNTFGYGLGWDSVDLAPFGDYGIKALTKGGDTLMYHSALIALPEEDVSIALLTSGGSSVYNTAAATNILLAYLKEKGDIAEILPAPTFSEPVKKDMPDRLRTYAGWYGTVGSTLRITVDNGEVKLPTLMGLIPEQTYVYTGEDEFTGTDGRTVISFDKQTNGHTYIRVKSHLEFPGLGQAVMAYYEYQKLADNPVTETVSKAWKERNGRTYYALDEKINSLFYLSPSVLTKKIELNEDGGYANGAKITDEDHAVNVAEIPVMNGRDAFDLEFFRKDGIEYLRADGRTYVGEAAVKPIYGGASSIVTIPAESGGARWFKIGGEAAGRTMTVDLPQHAGFVVYDAKGALVSFSAASGSRTAVLPEDGLIVFGGRPGDVLKINMTAESK